MRDPSGPVGSPEGEGQLAERRRRRDLRLAASGVLVALLVWFAVANLQGVRIRFWLTSASAPLIVVIVISGFLGAAVAGLVGRASRRRGRSGDGGS